ncbi:MAG: redoxin domain-containing protein [Halobacteriaceae archaeon]
MAPDFDVVTLPETEHIDEGEQVPDFTRPLVTAEYWEDVALTELLDESPVVLIFHPMDGAFPTTYIWNEVIDRNWFNYPVQVVGLSISTPYEHKDTIKERGDTSIRLFSDPKNDVAERFGISHDLDGMTGISEPRPAIYVIDTDRKVKYKWVASEWPDFPDYDEVETIIERL